MAKIVHLINMSFFCFVFFSMNMETQFVVSVLHKLWRQYATKHMFCNYP